MNGIWGGYIEEGTKTVIPSKASAKISMRLVPGQDFKKIAKLFEKHFKAIAPKSVKVKVKFLHGGMPYVAPTDMPAYKAAEKAIADTFGKKPLPFYSGGSIPIISGFENILGIKSSRSDSAWRRTPSIRPTRATDSTSSTRGSKRFRCFINISLKSKQAIRFQKRDNIRRIYPVFRTLRIRLFKR